MNNLGKYITTHDNSYIYMELFEVLKQVIDDTMGETSNHQFIKPGLKNNKNTSYEWIDNAGEWSKLTSLYTGLKNRGFIDKSTKVSDFKAIFTGNAKTPVSWAGEGGLTEIMYLFYKLWGDDGITKQCVKKPKQPLKNLKNCFIYNGEVINIKSAKTTYSSIKKDECFPSANNEIDLLIKSL